MLIYHIVPNPFDSPVFASVIDAVALSSAGRSFGFPNIVNYNGGSFNISTGGILEVVLNDTTSRAFNTTSNLHGFSWQGGIIPSHTHIQGPFVHSNGFNNSYKVIQQGFTANVSCQSHDIYNVTGSPPTLTPFRNEVTYAIPALRVSSLLWYWTINCPDNKSYECKSGLLYTAFVQLLNFI